MQGYFDEPLYHFSKPTMTLLRGVIPDMRRLGFFGGFTVPKFCLDVANILAADNVRIDPLPIHSPERRYFVKFCTDTWKLEWTASNAAAVYRSTYQANGCVFPHNEDGVGEAIKRAERAAFAARVKRVKAAMTDDDYTRKLNELDHLLNDPHVSFDPARVW